MAVSPEAQRIDEAPYPLLLGDGWGIASWVCGERPRDLDAYVAARNKCSPGEVIFSYLDAAHHVRAMSIPHASDADFGRLFPFLELKGEREARARLQLLAFQRRLKDVSERSRSGQSAASQLASALILAGSALWRDPAYHKALEQNDSDLSAVFREWARRKVAAASKIRDPLEAQLFAGRSLDQPLSDMRLDGTPLPGCYASGKNIRLADWLPISYAVYRKELKPLEQIAKRPMSEGMMTKVRARISSDLSACTTARAAVSKAEHASQACVRQDASCPPSKAFSLSAAADPDRDRLETAKRNLALLLSSPFLPRPERDRMEKETAAAGCVD